MKFFILAALVAVSSAAYIPQTYEMGFTAGPTTTTTTGKHIQVSFDKILITSLTTGNHVYITKHLTPTGQRFVEFYVWGPSIANSRFQIEDVILKPELFGQFDVDFTLLGTGEFYTFDYLVQIFKKFEGVVTEEIFHKILLQIEQFVSVGHVNELVYGVLVVLDKVHDSMFWQQFLTKYMGFYKGGEMGFNWDEKFLGEFSTVAPMWNKMMGGRYMYPSYHNFYGTADYQKMGYPSYYHNLVGAVDYQKMDYPSYYRNLYGTGDYYNGPYSNYYGYGSLQQYQPRAMGYQYPSYSGIYNRMPQTLY